jgi:hypothetical protein
MNLADSSADPLDDVYESIPLFPLPISSILRFNEFKDRQTHIKDARPFFSPIVDARSQSISLAAFDNSLVLPGNSSGPSNPSTNPALTLSHANDLLSLELRTLFDYIQYFWVEVSGLTENTKDWISADWYEKVAEEIATELLSTARTLQNDNISLNGEPQDFEGYATYNSFANAALSAPCRTLFIETIKRLADVVESAASTRSYVESFRGSRGHVSPEG